jgi:predicted PurR-regulated permease PerM
MTFIPYIGPVLGGFVPFFMAIIGGSFNQAIWVVVIIGLAQLFDNYFIEPYVVGGSVNISPFFTIFILILGGVVWGIAGVILFLPLLGILKIVFENVQGLEPYAYLIGDQKKSNPQDKLLGQMRKLFKK